MYSQIAQRENVSHGLVAASLPWQAASFTSQHLIVKAAVECYVLCSGRSSNEIKPRKAFTRHQPCQR